MGDQGRPVDQRTHLLGARTTAGATVLGALITGLFGGILGGVLAAEVTENRNDVRGEREFLQTQRTALYGQYLAAAEKMNAAAEPLLWNNSRVQWGGRLHG